MTEVRTHRVEIYVTKEQEDELVGYAAMRGFKRDFPRRAWTNADRKRAINFAIRKFSLEPRTNRYD